MSWNFVIAPGNYALSTIGKEFDELIELEGEILLNRRRSFVKRVTWRGYDLVIKQPRAKDKSWWTRFTTLYRQSDVTSQFKSMIKLEHMGVPALTPVLVAEKRRFGCVVESRLVYLYEPGNAVDFPHYEQVVKHLHAVHTRGYVHKDPHIDNFVQQHNRVFLIDPAIKKNWWGPIGRAYNWRRLCHRRGEEIEIDSYLPMDKHSFAYRVANAFFNLRQGRVRLKRSVRKRLKLRGS